MPKHDFPKGVTLVGGAAVARCDFGAAHALAPGIVAADGGADRCAEIGVVPDLIVGDMDSMRGPIPGTIPVLRVEEQETTDFEKCLIHTDAPLCIGVGFLGGQLGHSLAALHALLVHAARPVVLIGEEDIAFASPADWSMEIAAGTRVSFFPLRSVNAIASRGLRWPVDGLRFEAGAGIGTSNEATGARVSASFDRPGCITMLPKTLLAPVVESLGAI